MRRLLYWQRHTPIENELSHYTWLRECQSVGNAVTVLPLLRHAACYQGDIAVTSDSLYLWHKISGFVLSFPITHAAGLIVLTRFWFKASRGKSPITGRFFYILPLNLGKKSLNFSEHKNNFIWSLNRQFDVFSTVHHSIELFHQPTLMHNILYSLTICLLHYYPPHVSSINMSIFRRKNCIHIASGIFALCKRLHSILVESGLSPLSTSVLCRLLQRTKIPDAVWIQFFLLKMGMLMLETFRG